VWGLKTPALLSFGVYRLFYRILDEDSIPQDAHCFLRSTMNTASGSRLRPTAESRLAVGFCQEATLSASLPSLSLPFPPNPSVCGSARIRVIRRYASRGSYQSEYRPSASLPNVRVPLRTQHVCQGTKRGSGLIVRGDLENRTASRRFLLRRNFTESQRPLSK